MKKKQNMLIVRKTEKSFISHTLQNVKSLFSRGLNAAGLQGHIWAQHPCSLPVLTLTHMLPARPPEMFCSPCRRLNQNTPSICCSCSGPSVTLWKPTAGPGAELSRTPPDRRPPDPDPDPDPGLHRQEARDPLGPINRKPRHLPEHTDGPT